jgi:hypothetical protein
MSESHATNVGQMLREKRAARPEQALLPPGAVTVVHTLIGPKAMKVERATSRRVTFLLMEEAEATEFRRGLETQVAEQKAQLRAARLWWRRMWWRA